MEKARKNVPAQWGAYVVLAPQKFYCLLCYLIMSQYIWYTLCPDLVRRFTAITALSAVIYRTNRTQCGRKRQDFLMMYYGNINRHQIEIWGYLGSINLLHWGGFLHFSYLPGPARVCISINYEVKMDRRKCDQGISYAQVRALKNSGKKPGSGNSGKIRIRNSLYFWTDF